MSNQISFTRENRIPFWDISKAFLIYLVILGHCVAAYRINGGSDILYRIIYEFHMPCFMMVSGFFAAKSIKKQGALSLVKYACRLLLPLVGFAVFQLIFVIEWATIRPIRIYGAFFDLWFLPVLFECVVAYYVVAICKSWLYRVFAFFFIWIASALAIDVPYLNLAWVYCSRFAFMWPFFILGAFISAELIEKMKSYLWGGGSLALYISLLYIVHPSSFWWCGFCSTDTWLNFLMAISGCMAFFFSTALVTQYVQKCNLLKKIGQSTLGIYILQFMYFAFPLPACLVLPFGNDYVSLIVLSLVITLLMYGIYFLTRRMMMFRLFLYGEARAK